MADYYDPITNPVADPERFINHYLMVPDYWRSFDVRDLPVDISHWECVKMFNDSCTDLNQETYNIPSEYGGIYVYVIKPPVIPSCGEYIMYVGKATKTSHENLRYRVRSYKSELGSGYQRDKIHRMFSKWGDYVYVRYLSVPGSVETITTLEDRLIDALVPPCNSAIRNPQVKRAVNAFNY